MIHETGIFRAPDKYGGVGSGSTTSRDEHIFRKVVFDGQAPDVDAVNVALGQLDDLYGALEVPVVDRAGIIKELRDQFDGGDRKGQMVVGGRILKLQSTLSEAVNMLNGSRRDS